MEPKKIKVLTIDEAVQCHLLTKQEGLDMHDWRKGNPLPVDQKHLIYYDGEFIKLLNIIRLRLK